MPYPPQTQDLVNCEVRDNLTESIPPECPVVGNEAVAPKLASVTITVPVLEWLSMRVHAPRSNDYAVVGDDIASQVRACPDATTAVHLRPLPSNGLWQLWPLKAWLASSEHKAELRKDSNKSSEQLSFLNDRLNKVRLHLRKQGTKDDVISDIVNHICCPKSPAHHALRSKVGLGPDKFNWELFNGSITKLTK